MVKPTGAYCDLFENKPHAMVVFGLIDGLILDANDAALALYGYRREEIVGLPYAALSAEPEVRTHMRKDGSKLMVETQQTTESFADREVGVLTVRPLV